jgi:hypothetical protein
MTVTDDQRKGRPLGAEPARGMGSACEAINQMLDAELLDNWRCRDRRACHVCVT